jgi:hypothetical protein
MITIVIPLGEGQLPLCEESLKKQTIKCEIIKEISKIETVKDIGKCRNLENVKKKINTKYVCICDSDVNVKYKDILERCINFLEENILIEGVCVDTKELKDYQFEIYKKNEHKVNCAFIVIKSNLYKKIDFTYITGKCSCMNFNRDAKICYLDYTTHLKEIPR